MRSRSRSLLAVLLTAAIVSACSDHKTPTGATTAPTSPSPAPSPEPGPAPTCAYALTATPDVFDGGGGNGALSIATTPGCKWAVKSDATWAVIEDVQEGEGAARLKVYVQPNGTADARRMTFTTADQSATLTQSARVDCVYQVSPVAETIPRLAWQGQVAITTGRGCAWNASSDAGWVRLQQTGGYGSATVAYSADFNPATQTGDQRTAVLAFRWPTPTAGQNVRVTQTGDCALAIYPATDGLPAGASYSGGVTGGTLTASAAGGQVHFWILVEPPLGGCAWDVESADSWVTFVFPALRQVMSGDGDLHFTLPPNPSSQSRRAVLTMDGKPLTVVQQGR